MTPEELTNRKYARRAVIIAGIAILLAGATFIKVLAGTATGSIKAFFDELSHGVRGLPWDGPLARLIAVMAICGGIGAFVHALVVGERSLVWPGKKRDEATGTLKVQLGFLSDVIVGAVAANVLHFPLATVFDYTSLLSTGASNDKPYLSIIALSILAGYTGPTLLDALGRKFQDSMVAKLEERLQRAQSMVTRTLTTLLQDVLTRSVRPNETEIALLKAKFEDAQAVELSKGIEKLGPLDALFAGYYQLEAGNYPEAVRYLEIANTKGELAESQKWSAKNLLGLAYHYNSVNQAQWFEKASAAFRGAMESKPTPIQEAMTLANIGYINHDNGERAEALTNWKMALVIADRLPASARQVVSILRLGLAAHHTEEALSDAPEQKATHLEEAKSHLLEIQNPSDIAHLLRDESISDRIKEEWNSMAGLPEIWKRLL